MLIKNHFFKNFYLKSKQFNKNLKKTKFLFEYIEKNLLDFPELRIHHEISRKELDFYPPQIKNFPALVLHVGWTVEGRDRSQLPEQLLSGLTVIRADLSKGDGANTDKLNHLLEEYNVGNGIDPYKITPKQWLERGLQYEKQ